MPRAGVHYARTRNFDFGQENRGNVSQLSPWIRHRLITEDEVLTAVLSQHGLAAAEKFVQEVCWRTYWKGWLEMRPSVWRDYRDAIAPAHDTLSADDRDRLAAAMRGETDIECLNAWSRELTSSGYLHNHTRMWFASIWIFTLRLPWQLGADFFMRHLLDGDAASNTLSWRWVAGLQTVGKNYLARAENIAKYTNQRFVDTPGLSPSAQPILGRDPMPPMPLAESVPPDTAKHTALLITDDDLAVSRDLFALPQLANAVYVDTTAWRCEQTASPEVQRFVDGAVDDLADRLVMPMHRVAAEGEEWAGELGQWCETAGIEQLVSLHVPVGPSTDALQQTKQILATYGITMTTVIRPWDRLAWPYATKGFFNFKKHIPTLLQDSGIVFSGRKH